MSNQAKCSKAIRDFRNGYLAGRKDHRLGIARPIAASGHCATIGSVESAGYDHGAYRQLEEELRDK